MNNDHVEAPPQDILGAALAEPQVHRALDEVAEAATRLRFHEGLRRGWQEARAEAAVREATALATFAGVRISLDELRQMTLAPDSRPRDPASSMAFGIWRSQWNLASSLAPLNTRTPVAHRRPPLPALLASLHRDVCSALVEDRHIPLSTVASPTNHLALAAVNDYVRAPLPAVVKVAALVAHFRVNPVFSPASDAVGSALARRVLVESGVDPTGVLILSWADGTDPHRAAYELEGWTSGTSEGVVQWILHVASTLVVGAKAGQDVALHVQAGRLG